MYTNIILFIFLLAVIFLIIANYRTRLTKNSYLTGIFLYIIFGLLYVTLLGRIFTNFEIFRSHYMISFIMIFILSCISFFLINNGNLVINSLGYLLFLTMMSILVSFTIAGSSTKNIQYTLMISALLVAILTGIVYFSSERILLFLISLTPILNFLLIIFFFLIIGSFFLNYGVTFSKYLYSGLIILFVLYVLADTSRIVFESQNLECQTHYCVNYSGRSVNLLIDYLYIFLNLTNLSR